MLPFSHVSFGGPLPDNSCHCALVLGHPGHELKVFGWMSEYRPLVYVITDGSGRQGVSRTPSTAGVISQLGSEPGEIFGCISDADIYRAMLEQNFTCFVDLVDRLADSFSVHEINVVAGDAAEGFNPTHDLCRALINAAVLKAQRITATPITNLEFSLTEWEQNSPEPDHDDLCIHFTLDDGLLAAKVKAAEGYPELKHEVQRALVLRGREYFRLECLRKVAERVSSQNVATKPLYEVCGEQRMAAGQYCEVIRFREHILPIMNAIRNYALQTPLEPSLAGRTPYAVCPGSD